MLNALYNYAIQHPEIRQLPGFEQKNISFVVDLSSRGDLIGVRALDKKDRSVLCPSAGTITSGINAHPIAEKATIAICMETEQKEPLTEKKAERQEKSLAAKREIFLHYFTDGSAEVPEFSAILSALTDPILLSKIKEEFVSAGGQPKDTVSFAVGGRDLWSLPTVVQWWLKAKTPAEDEEMPSAIDVVTGKPCVPARLWKQMRGKAAAGGQSSGVSLVTFNAKAFESFGFDGRQGENCPVSKDTADAIMDAAIYLSGKAPSISTLRILHWYDGKVEPENDVLGFALDDLDYTPVTEDVNEAAQNANADKLVRSPFTGDTPPDLSSMVFNIIFLQPQAARMVIRRHEKGNYGDLYQAISSWFEGMRVVTRSGFLPQNIPGVRKMIFGLLSDAELASSGDKLAPISHIIPSILDACFFGRSLPDTVGYRAVSGFRSGMYPGAGKDIDWGRQYRRIQWIKLWLNRKNQTEKGGNNTMPQIPESIDTTLSRPAYVCGRLMAAYDTIQRMAANLNSTVVSRYFTACSQSPALVLGQLQRMSVHHLEAITNGFLKDKLQDELQQCWSLIEGNIPARLSIQDQAYFACGYWQEMANLQKRLNGNKNNNIKEDM